MQTHKEIAQAKIDSHGKKLHHEPRFRTLDADVS